MAFVIKDRVKEGTTTTGTGDIALGGATATFDAFTDHMSNGDTTHYAIVHTASGTDEWEVGIGTWNTGNTLTRTTVLAGSSGTTQVNFSEGNKDVFMTQPASATALLDTDSTDLAASVTLGNHDTDDLAEGTNLYYTDARVDAHLSGGTGVTYSGGAISIGQSVGTSDDVEFDNITADGYIDLKHFVTKPAHAEGRLFYDDAFGALAFYNDEADITLQIGQEEYIRVKNNSGATITNGTPVYLTGEDSGTPTIGKAIANGTFSQSQAVAVATHDIENNSIGYVTTRGLIADVDTSHLTAGKNVHVAPDGGTQEMAPTYPYFATDIGMCLISNATTGCIYVNVQSHAAETFRATENAHFDADVTIDGNLTVNGTQTITNSNNISLTGAFNYFNSGDTIGDANTTHSGSGLDDATLTGHYEGTTTNKTFYVKIDGTGTPDTFSWSTDNFATTEATGVAITGADQALADGISVKFNATTGHTLNDVWSGSASPVNVDSGIASNRNTGGTGIGYTHMGMYYDVSTNKWTFFDEYDPEPNGTIDTTDLSFSLGTVLADTFEGNLTGNVTGDVTGNLAGNATTATTLATARTIGGVSFNGSANINLPGVNTTGNQNTTGSAAKLTTARTISLTGDVSGSATFDGSANASITATIADDSHNHTIANVDGLQTALDAKALGATTISAGGGLTGGGSLAGNRTISHADTSTQASVNNSGGIVIQDITLDGYGHITALGSANLDGRYYTESEADARFINASGDTMTGALRHDQDSLTASGGTLTINLANANNFYVTMTANTTFAFSSKDAGRSGNIIVKQDATGGRTFTLPAECKTPVGGLSIVQETGANELSVLSYYVVDANNILVNYIGDFA